MYIYIYIIYIHVHIDLYINIYLGGADGGTPSGNASTFRDRGAANAFSLHTSDSGVSIRGAASTMCQRRAVVSPAPCLGDSSAANTTPV